MTLTARPPVGVALQEVKNEGEKEEVEKLSANKQCDQLDWPIELTDSTIDSFDSDSDSDSISLYLSRADDN